MNFNWVSFRNSLHVSVLALGLLGLSTACVKHSQPNMTYMPEMAYSPALKAQEVGAMRVPVKGTVPRGFKPYAYFEKGIELAGQELKNPVAFNRANLMRGQVVYNAQCKACHGADGQGGGSIVPKFQRPPSLHSEKILGYSDGQIFHVMTVGQNIMPSYAGQVSAEDRWAVVNYIRVLQRSQAPTEQDLKSAGVQN
jgi:mono/diheme cytochrome c family protein